MQILHIITTIERGGAEIQLLSLARKQVQSGTRVSCLYFKGAPDLRQDFEKAGVSVDKFSLTSFLVRPTRYLQWLRGFNVIHAHLSRAELFVFIASFIIHRGYFVTRHNTETISQKIPLIVSKNLSRAILDRALGVIAISDAVKNFLISEMEISKTQKITTIHYGYERAMRSSSLNSRIRHGVRSTERNLKFLTIGRLEPQKNLLTLINAISPFLKESNSSLTIIGEGSLRKKIQKHIELSGLTNHVYLLGKKEDVFEDLNRADLFLLFSKYEGFGLVLLEAMDCGIRIVANRVPAVEEVLGNDFEFLIDVRNEIETRLSIKIALNRSMEWFAQSYQPRLQKFDAVENCKKHQEVYGKATQR